MKKQTLEGAREGEDIDESSPPVSPLIFLLLLVLLPLSSPSPPYMCPSLPFATSVSLALYSRYLSHVRALHQCCSVSVRERLLRRY